LRFPLDSQWELKFSKPEKGPNLRKMTLLIRRLATGLTRGWKLNISDVLVSKYLHSILNKTLTVLQFLSASLYVSKRGAY